MTGPTYADFHVHTHYSPCGKARATAGAMIRRAREKGLAAIGFADHFTPRPIPGCPFYRRQRLHILDALRAEIAFSQQGEVVPGDCTGDIQVLVGVEADYTLAGAACLDREARARTDHVICGASHFHLPAAPRPVNGTPRARAELMLHTAREALAVPGVSVWAHPFDCSRMRPLVPIVEAMAEDELAELIDRALAREVAVEINGGAARREDYRRAMELFFRLARERGARFTITADAHHPDDLHRLDLALGWARAMGFEDKDLLDAEELLDRQRRKVAALGSLP